MVGKWFRRRLTWAMGIYTLAMSVGFMVAFLLSAPSCYRVVGAWHGPRAASRDCSSGADLVDLVRSTPESIGEEMDGGSGDQRAQRP